MVAVVAGMLIIASGVLIWAFSTGALSSLAFGIGDIGGIGGGNTGYFANLSGKVTDKATGKGISGATVQIRCTNSKTGFTGTNVSDITKSDGTYALTKANGGKDIKTRTVTSAAGGSITHNYTYTMTVSATGYTTVTRPNLSWPDQEQGATLSDQDFELSKGSLPPTTTDTKYFFGSLYKVVNGVTSTACMTVVGPDPTSGGCTVNLTMTPTGSKQWLHVGRTVGSQTVVSVSEPLKSGTYQITGGDFTTAQGANYDLIKVNGTALPYTFTMTSTSNFSANLKFQ